MVKLHTQFKWTLCVKQRYGGQCHNSQKLVKRVSLNMFKCLVVLVHNKSHSKGLQGRLSALLKKGSNPFFYKRVSPQSKVYCKQQQQNTIQNLRGIQCTACIPCHLIWSSNFSTIFTLEAAAAYSTNCGGITCLVPSYQCQRTVVWSNKGSVLIFTYEVFNPAEWTHEGT